MSNKGRTFSKEWRKHLSESHKKLRIPREIRTCACGCGQTFECRINSKRKFINGHNRRGVKVVHSQETILKISNSLKGHLGYGKGEKRSDDLKKKVSNSVKKWHQENKNTDKYKKRNEKIKQARLKQIIPTKDTSIEIKLQEELNKLNIKYEKHKPILGQPDIFVEPNVCIFADGNYWHNFPKGTEKDREITKLLEGQGYKVLRFWESEINDNIELCIDSIKVWVWKNLDIDIGGGSYQRYEVKK